MVNVELVAVVPPLLLDDVAVVKVGNGVFWGGCALAVVGMGVDVGNVVAASAVTVGDMVAVGMAVGEALNTAADGVRVGRPLRLDVAVGSACDCAGRGAEHPTSSAMIKIPNVNF
jgi:hypothetical protein